jgi:hypothetical protein
MFLSFKGILTNIRMVKKDDFWSTVIGLFLGAVGIVVLTEALKPKCPRCKNKMANSENQ